MIKASELRIGNIVWESNSVTPGPEDFNEIVIASINDIDKVIRDDQENGYSYDALYGIPLTPEWLERCGFVTDGTGDDNHTEPLWDHPKTNYQYSDGALVHNGSAYDDWHDIGNVDYVHQLQNLFYWVTGKELEIKL
jgi:hypothetical protein